MSPNQSAAQRQTVLHNTHSAQFSPISSSSSERNDVADSISQRGLSDAEDADDATSVTEDNGSGDDEEHEAVELDADITSTKRSPRKRKRAVIEEDSGDESAFSVGSEGPVPSKKMTARQRAMVAREAGEDVAEEMFSDLPDERASKRKIFTEEEMALRKSETARRRKHQAHARAEEAKHATIQKLLTKQVNKKKTKDEDTSPMKEDVDPTQIRYIQTSQMSTLSFPQHLLDSEPFLLAPAGGNAEYPLQKLCSIPGCSKPKKYRHISAEMDVCGMNHFRVAGLGVNNEL